VQINGTGDDLPPADGCSETAILGRPSPTGSVKN
jgi:hypothetical protein